MLTASFSSMSSSHTSATLEQRQSLSTIDCLLDAFLAVYYDCSEYQTAYPHQESIQKFLSKYEKTCQQLKNIRINKDDFEIIRPLAHGLFGTVSVVRSRLDGQVYAMKVLSKDPLLQQQEKAFSMEERLVLSHPQSSCWMPVLHAAFQDVDNLYLVMEYAGGGDLFSVLDRKENLVLNEEEAKFYLAETILAVDSLHRLGYVHRDIKPQNILIDHHGHVKLADFGSCIPIDHCTKIPPTASVGTCDYVSPEVLASQQGNVTYGTEVDWWSVGIVLYEVLQENPPFYTQDSESETYRKIVFHESTLAFNHDIPISEEAQDLIRKFLCRKEERLGRHGINEIQDHPFFKGIDWKNIKQAIPPFLPVLSSPDDTSNFSVPEQDLLPKTNPSRTKKEGVYEGKHLPFIGYTYSNLMPKTSYDLVPILQEAIEGLRSMPSKSTQKHILNVPAKSSHSDEKIHSDLWIQEKQKEWQMAIEKKDIQLANLELKIQSLIMKKNTTERIEETMDQKMKEAAENYKQVEKLLLNEQEQHTATKLQLKEEQARSLAMKSQPEKEQEESAVVKLQLQLDKEKEHSLALKLQLRNEQEQHSAVKSLLQQEQEQHSSKKSLLKSLQKELETLKTRFKNSPPLEQHSIALEKAPPSPPLTVTTLKEPSSLFECQSCQLSQAASDNAQRIVKSLQNELTQLRSEVSSKTAKQLLSRPTPSSSSSGSSPPQNGISPTEIALSVQGKNTILSTMWKKDRERLRDLEQTLEDSEKKLYLARKEMARLRKDRIQRHDYEEGLLLKNRMQERSMQASIAAREENRKAHI
ncbi:kinase-like domain-containing protein [Spinellus fusiger]|nr:kinase-like domain-containing protein [Spinellus fusiger]